MVDTLIDIAQVPQDASIDEANLNAEFVRQPGLVFYYVSKSASAERQVSELKLRLEATEAKVASNVRAKALEDNLKLTVDAIKEQVRLHPTVVKVEQELIQAQEVLGILKAACEAMRNKKDMLVVRGNMLRDEIKARLEILEPTQVPGGSVAGAATKRQLLERTERQGTA